MRVIIIEKIPKKDKEILNLHDDEFNELLIEYFNNINKKKRNKCYRNKIDFEKRYFIYSEKVNFSLLCFLAILKESFIRKFKHKFNFRDLTLCQKLSESFIIEFQEHIDWLIVSYWGIEYINN